MTAATATPEMLSSPTPFGVNLDDVERGMRNASGTDLTEAKEAVVEALLQRLACNDARERVARAGLSSVSNLQRSL